MRGYYMYVTAVVWLSIWSLSNPVTLNGSSKKTGRKGAWLGCKRNRRPGSKTKMFKAVHCNPMLRFYTAIGMEPGISHS